MSKKTIHSKMNPFLSLVVVAAAVWFAEYFIMRMLALFPSITPAESIFIDSAALICLVFPVLYLTVYRPQKESLAALEHAYREALENKNKFETIVQSSPDCIKLFNLKSEVVFENHKNLHKACGNKAGKCGYIESLAEESQLKFQQAVQKVLLGEKSVIEVKHIPGSPREVCMEVIVPLKDATGTMVGYYGVSRDISAYKRLEQLKEDLIRMVAHDLNNPLAAILLGVQYLEFGFKDSASEQQKEAFRNLITRAEEIRDMVNNLLDISLMEENRLILKKSEVDPNALIEKTIRLMRLVAESDRKSVVAIPGPVLPKLYADEETIIRVIANLVRNSLKFSPEKSRVEIGAAYDSDRKELTFSVKDHGMGIAKESLTRIFEKFARVENSQTAGIAGKGLGLTFCKMAVESHGGRIWVESELGQGSIFYFTIPSKG